MDKKGLLFSVAFFVVLLETFARLSFAFSLGDINLLAYPFLEQSQEKFTYNNYSPSGSLEPQNEKDSYRKYKPEKKKIYISEEDGKLIKGFASINSHGFRTPEYEIHKEDGTIRVVCVGESSTFGAFNKDENTWPRQLEDQLNTKFDNQKYEVLNLGVSESHILHHAALVESEVLKLKPDVVIFYMGYNDVRRFMFGQENQIKLSRSFSLVHELFRIWKMRGFYKDKISSFDSAAADKKSQLTKEFQNHLDLIYQNLKGAKLLLVRQPLAPTEKADKLVSYKEWVNKVEAKALNKLSSDEVTAFLHHQLFEDLEAKGYSILKPDYKDVGGRKNFLSLVHLNKEGNKFLAEYLIPFIDPSEELKSKPLSQ